MPGSVAFGLKKPRLWAAGIGLAVAACLAVGIGGPNRAHPHPANGTLDLRAWNFVQDGPLRLDGQWRFIPGRFVPSPAAELRGSVPATVPGAWPAREAATGQTSQYGYGTYVLRLTLPPAPQGESFAINTGQMWSAYRLFANGVAITRRGMPSRTAAGEHADSYATVALIPAGARSVVLALEISNHIARTGGIFTSPTIGLESTLSLRRHLTEAVSLLVIGALLFAACYHIAFLRLTRATLANVWFGILASLFALRMVTFEPLASFFVVFAGQDWVWRIDLLATGLLVPATYWSIALCFPRYLSRRGGLVLSAVCASLALSGIVFGSRIGNVSFKGTELIGLGAIVYLVQAVIRAAWAGEKGAALALLGLSACSLGAFHDILMDNQLAVGPNLLPLGSVAFFLCFSGALTQRSHHAFIGVEQLVDARTRLLREKIVELERAREAAQSANVAKSRFLANMSHELRTPLNAILGFSEIIRDQMLGPGAGTRYADYAGHIHTSGSHLLGLINDILDLSKIEAGKLDLVDAPLDMDQECAMALHLVEPQARRGGVGLAVETAAPLRVSADGRAMRQILANLLSNAVKFTPSGGQVTLAVTRRADGATLISVRDTGIGIRPEDMARVFESFGQARHDVRTTEERGTGLGLPITKGLVEAMGGSIVLTSEIRKGTTVTVVLPAERSVEPPSLARAL